MLSHPHRPDRRKRWLIFALAVLAAHPGRARAAETAAERRLRHLEEELERAQQQIHDLQNEMKQQRAVGMATQRQAEQADESAKTASAKAIDIPDVLKRITPFGDVRYRHEGFYHQPSTNGQVVTARNRKRVRARLGIRVALGDELSATIRTASGNVNDPISTNETLTGNFTRKNWNLDWAYLTVTPGQTFNIRPGLFSITGGKFPLTMFRTDELVFDEDLSPEGVNETIQLLAKPAGSLDQLRLHLFQWTFDEVANKQDGWTFGGQLNPSLHFGDVQVEGGLAQ